MTTSHRLTPEDIAIHNRLGWAMWDQEARQPANSHRLREYSITTTFLRLRKVLGINVAGVFVDPSRGRSLERIVTNNRRIPRAA